MGMAMAVMNAMVKSRICWVLGLEEALPSSL